MIKSIFLIMTLSSWFAFGADAQINAPTWTDATGAIIYGAPTNVVRGPRSSTRGPVKGYRKSDESLYAYTTKCPHCHENTRGSDSNLMLEHLVTQHRARIIIVEQIPCNGNCRESKTSWNIVYQVPVTKNPSTTSQSNEQ